MFTNPQPDQNANVLVTDLGVDRNTSDNNDTHVNHKPLDSETTKQPLEHPEENGIKRTEEDMSHDKSSLNTHDVKGKGMEHEAPKQKTPSQDKPRGSRDTVTVGRQMDPAKTNPIITDPVKQKQRDPVPDFGDTSHLQTEEVYKPVPKKAKNRGPSTQAKGQEHTQANGKVFAKPKGKKAGKKNLSLQERFNKATDKANKKDEMEEKRGREKKTKNIFSSQSRGNYDIERSTKPAVNYNKLSKPPINHLGFNRNRSDMKIEARNGRHWKESNTKERQG